MGRGPLFSSILVALREQFVRKGPIGTGWMAAHLRAQRLPGHVSQASAVGSRCSHRLRRALCGVYASVSMAHQRNSSAYSERTERGLVTLPGAQGKNASSNLAFC